MAKGLLYVSTRSGKRPEKIIVKNGLDHFISTGVFAGSPELAAEIINYSLDRSWAITIGQSSGVVSIHRV